MGIELPAFAQAIDFIDENDGGLVLGRLFKDFAHAPRAHAHEDFIEVAAMSAEELSVRLAGNSFGQHGLAGPGRANQQHAFREIPAQPFVFFGITEEIDNLLHLSFGLFDSGDIFETGARASLDFVAGFSFANAHLVPHQSAYQPNDNNGGDDVDDLSFAA